MGIVEIVFILAIMGFISWLILAFVPMPVLYKQVLVGLMSLGAILYFLNHSNLMLHH